MTVVLHTHPAEPGGPCLKSVRRERMAENLDVFDFTLSDAEMDTLRGLDTGETAFFSHQSPEAVEMLTGHGNPRR